MLVLDQLLNWLFQCLHQQELLHHQISGHLSPLHGGRDQSDCYYFGNSFGGRREPNQVCGKLQQCIELSSFISWSKVFLFRGLSCIVDASNLSLAHMTFWNPIEVQSLKSWSQRHLCSWGEWSTCARRAFPWGTRGSTTSTCPPLSTPCSTLSRQSSARRFRTGDDFFGCPKSACCLLGWN